MEEIDRAADGISLLEEEGITRGNNNPSDQLGWWDLKSFEGHN